MKLRILCLLCAAWLPIQAHADFAGVRAGVGGWYYDIEGTFRYQSGDSQDDIDVNDDLGYSDDTLIFGYAAVEHPIPFLPNVKATVTNIDSDGSGSLSGINFGGITFDGDVDSEVSIDQVDVALYYELLDNVVSLDLGLNFKYASISAKIEGTSGVTAGLKETADFDGIVPMAYGAAYFNLPLTGLSVGGDGSYTKYKDSDLADFQIKASYASPWHIGVEGGYRAIKLDIDDIDDFTSDLDFDGFFASAFVHF